MLDTSTNSSSAKSFLFFIVILLSGVLITAVMLNGKKDGATQDIRSHASNEADTLVDSDAVMAAGEMEVNSLENDADLQDRDAEVAAEDAELAEINAL